MAVDLAVQFHDDDLMAYNTVAEIPGTDLKDEVVMLGGHMDSWHSGTGATDNAAGVAVAMEAVRILKALDLKPRRTVRIAPLERRGAGPARLAGLRHRALRQGRRRHRPSARHPGRPEQEAGDVKPTVDDRSPSYEKFSAYFNLDNGTGKIRGVYLQGNEAVRPIFRKWLAAVPRDGRLDPHDRQHRRDRPPVVRRHRPARLPVHPGPIEYGTRTHHSNQDVFDRDPGRRPEAGRRRSWPRSSTTPPMRDEKLPRKPTPRRIADHPGDHNGHLGRQSLTNARAA